MRERVCGVVVGGASIGAMLLIATVVACGGNDASSMSGGGEDAGAFEASTSSETGASADGSITTSDTGIDAPVGPSITLKDNRDRLIDTLAVVKGTTRCPLWKALTPTQKGVFLTITDLLGKRTFMGASPSTGTALPHVTKVYEIRDKGGFGNGGGDNNRIFLQFDATLIAAMRDVDGPLPEWAKSTDAAGPHDPFDATSETVNGQPRGQSHFWSADDKAKPLGRPGVETVNDARVVEIDIDYNFLHDSNPEGDYFGKSGRALYAEKWSSLGLGGSPEFDYVPTTCP